MKTVETAHKRVNIRHNDTVKVIAGRDKGKEGRVLRVFPDEGKALVEHVKMCIRDRIGVKCWVYKGEILPAKKREPARAGAF